MLKIVRIPNTILSSAAKPIALIDNKIKKLVYEMEETLIAQDDPPGVGLAAPQIGQDISLFIIKPNPRSNTQVFINPKIIKSEIRNPKAENTSEKNMKLEGCLAIPRIWSPVRRAKKIMLEYQDLTGKWQTKWFSGFESIIIQHELDHLSGILFTQRSVEQNLPLYEEKNGELEKMRHMP